VPSLTSLRRIARPFASVAAAATVLFAAAPEARANSRFPESNAMFFAPNNPDLVLLRVTFGLLVSRDRGKTWDWVCEPSIGLTGSEDPMYTVTPTGTILGSTFQGLTISRDTACSFEYAGGALNELVFIDVTTRPSTPDKVLVFASSYGGQNPDLTAFYKSTVYETVDDGKTFTALGPDLDKSLLGETVDIAPSDPDRIYVSALRNAGQATRVGVVLRSRDHGKTYEEVIVPLIDTEKAPFMSGIDPKNPDRIYVRTSNASDKPSRLLVSDDAGTTFRTIFTGAGPLMGIAFTPDGSKVYVGGPLDGLHVASTTDFAFTKKKDISIQCLAFRDDGLWACSNEKGGFIAGLSKDDGANFEPKLRLCEIRGALDCPAGSKTNFQCVVGGEYAQRAQTWPAQKSRLGCSPPEGDAAVDGAAPDAAPSDPGIDAGGGGCAVRGPTVFSPLAAVGAAIAALAALSRRRRR